MLVRILLHLSLDNDDKSNFVPIDHLENEEVDETTFDDVGEVHLDGEEINEPDN